MPKRIEWLAGNPLALDQNINVFRYPMPPRGKIHFIRITPQDEEEFSTYARISLRDEVQLNTITLEFGWMRSATTPVVGSTYVHNVTFMGPLELPSNFSTLFISVGNMTGETVQVGISGLIEYEE